MDEDCRMDITCRKFGEITLLQLEFLAILNYMPFSKAFLFNSVMRKLHSFEHVSRRICRPLSVEQIWRYTFKDGFRLSPLHTYALIERFTERFRAVNIIERRGYVKMRLRFYPMLNGTLTGKHQCGATRNDGLEVLTVGWWSFCFVFRVFVQVPRVLKLNQVGFEV